MTIQWEAYDIINWFELFDAACLWFEFEPSMRVALNVPPSVTALVREMKPRFLVMKHQFPDYFLEPKGVYGSEHIGDSMDILYYQKPERYYFPYLIRRQLLIEYANSVGHRPKFLFPEERASFEAAPDPIDNGSESIPDRQLDTRSYNTWRRLFKGAAMALNWLPDNSDTVGKIVGQLERSNIVLSDDTIRRYLRVRQILGDSSKGIPAIIPVASSTWWAGVKSGRFPKPVKLGPRTTVWRVEDIRALIENPTGTDPKQSDLLTGRPAKTPSAV